MSAAFIITGRTFVDWAFCGKMIPRDAVRLACMFCGAPLTVSAEGARKLEEKRRDPEFDPKACGAACLRCVKEAATAKPIAGVETSTQGAALLERSQNARDLMQFLIERVK